MSFFEQHPLRYTLSNELHARPPVPLDVPENVSYLAFMHTPGSKAREDEHLAALANFMGLPAPSTESGHIFLSGSEFRLKWQRHNEYSSYAFYRKLPPDAPEGGSALDCVPLDWRSKTPGQLIVATHIEIRKVSQIPPETVMLQHSPFGETQVASQVAEGAGWVLTDFHIHDGFSRFLLLDDHMTPRQSGRMVQRLLEIETYRVLALLAFPVAKEVGSLLWRAESELADLMDQMGQSDNSEDERQVLARLTRLAAEIERSVAKTTFRFGAASAYYRLTRQRINELREKRVNGLPTISEFMERRLAPAINTCTSIAHRQDELSARIARSSQLLRTRVEVELERQNQELLAQMNTRAKLQLRLQETVEGLSVVAITYYGSQLVNYLSKGLKTWLPVPVESIVAVSIPMIAGLAYVGIRHTRRLLGKEEV